MKSVSLALGALIAASTLGSAPAHAEDCWKVLGEAGEACDARENEARLGKYFCYIIYMAGIQYPMNAKGDDVDQSQEPYVGKINPADGGKFTIEIKRNPKAGQCQGDSMLCKRFNKPFVTESKHIFGMSGYGDSTFNFETFGGHLSVYTDFSFDAHRNWNGSYVAKGRCERIN